MSIGGLEGNKMKCVITGGGGFVGSHFVRKLLEEGHEVIVFDNLSSGRSKNLDPFADHKAYSFVKGDVTNKESVSKVLTKDVDSVFHLSSVVGVKNYCKDPLNVVDVNILGTRNVLEFALKNEIKFVFTSTSEVFGKNPKVPWSEDDDRVVGSTKIDRWSYSTSKAMCEHMIFALHKNQGFPGVVVRYFNIYGPGQQPYFVISQSIYKALRGEKPLLYDSGNQTRCFTYIDDAIEGTLLAFKSPKAVGEAFNIGSSKETKIKDAIHLINSLSGKKDTHWEEFDTTRQYGNKYEDIERRVPDVSKAKKLLDWEATTELPDGLMKTIEWSKKNTWWLD